MKSEIYHLIILDESGSMSCVQKQTISGCNETINTIRAAQDKFADTQDHFVSIFAFQHDGDRPSRYLIKNTPIADVRHITAKDYIPWGGTPLYDAVGSTLSDLKAVTKDKEMAIGSVTIITDGMENASRHYTRHKIAMMIEALKEMGWNFNFIGANIDVEATAQSLNIDNSLEFQQDEEGTNIMFAKEKESRMKWIERTNLVMRETRDSGLLCEEERKVFKKKMRDASKDYFKS